MGRWERQTKWAWPAAPVGCIRWCDQVQNSLRSSFSSMTAPVQKGKCFQKCNRERVRGDLPTQLFRVHTRGQRKQMRRFHSSSAFRYKMGTGLIFHSHAMCEVLVWDFTTWSWDYLGLIFVFVCFMITLQGFQNLIWLWWYSWKSKHWHNHASLFFSSKNVWFSKLSCWYISRLVFLFIYFFCQAFLKKRDVCDVRRVTTQYWENTYNK